MKQLKRTDIPLVKKTLLGKQKGLCLICKRNLYELPSKDVCLDHNHKSWMVRGVLCRQCNVLEAKVSKTFVRYGAKNKGIDYVLFLKGLIKFNSIKDTVYRYPDKPKRRRKKK